LMQDRLWHQGSQVLTTWSSPWFTGRSGRLPLVRGTAQ
jgi:hypothetical protein